VSYCRESAHGEGREAAGCSYTIPIAFDRSANAVLGPTHQQAHVCAGKKEHANKRGLITKEEYAKKRGEILKDL
jgi:hypothetical protein